MRSKQGLCSQQPGVADMLHDSPGNAQSVKGTGSASDLIQDQQTVSGRVSQNIGYLGHLHHKGTLAACQIVGSAHTGKDAVTDTDIRLVRRNKAADLRH